MRLRDIHPGDEELRVILEAGFLLREASRFEEAEAVFRGAVELRPESDVPRVALGRVMMHLGRFAEAQAACEEALRLNPASLYARVHHAEALFLQQRRDEAEAELQEVIAAHPDSPHSPYARALLDEADRICPREPGPA